MTLNELLNAQKLINFYKNWWVCAFVYIIEVMCIGTRKRSIIVRRYDDLFFNIMLHLENFNLCYHRMLMTLKYCLNFRKNELIQLQKWREFYELRTFGFLIVNKFDFFYSGEMMYGLWKYQVNHSRDKRIIAKWSL